MSDASRGQRPEIAPPGPLLSATQMPDGDSPAESPSTGLVAVATDIGAWRVIEPVLRLLQRRRVACRLMLAEPAAGIAGRDGVAHAPLTGRTVPDQAAQVLATHPTTLLLGTSVRGVVERELTRQARAASPAIPTLAVLDAMLFVERRFGPGLVELADVVACPDSPTADRLRTAGAPAAALVATGNPTLEAIAQQATCASPPPPSTGPVDVLFVSSPVARMRLRGAFFAIDEREALADVLAALGSLLPAAPHGFRVRVRLHPVQQPDALPASPPGMTLEPDADPDRLRSCARARVVVGLSSTLLGEARFLPRAAVAYLPGPFWDRERVFAPEYGVRLARSPEQLRSFLYAALTEPPTPPPDGHQGAAGRIADVLTTLAATAPHSRSARRP